MATVNQILEHDGWILYEVGQGNWAHPSVLTFDDRVNRPLSSETIIDIVLLGEGYLDTDTDSDKSDFETHLSTWYDTVFNIWPYNQFIHSFRVRGLFTPSIHRTDTSGSGYFGITLDPETPTKVGFDVSDSSFREKLFDVLKFIKDEDDLNTRLYSDELTIGLSGDDLNRISSIRAARSSDTYQNLMRNCVVAVAFMDADGSDGSGSSIISGFFTHVTSPEGHSLGDGTRVSIAFGMNYAHEFSHAFNLLLDEYIDVRESFAHNRQEPSHKSVFELWNLAYTCKDSHVPWQHLSWNGIFNRPSDSLVGRMWIGGRGKEKGVWHSEYKCLMNGGHRNYFNRTDEPDIHVWDSTKREWKQVFAGLRRGHFCLWCEEIVTIKILEKTDTLLRFEDIELSRGNINELGKIWYQRWVNDLRPVYWIVFQLENRILAREQYYSIPSNLDNLPHFDGDISDTNLKKAIIERKKGSNYLSLIT